MKTAIVDLEYTSQPLHQSMIGEHRHRRFPRQGVEKLLEPAKCQRNIVDRSL